MKPMSRVLWKGNIFPMNLSLENFVIYLFVNNDAYPF